MTDGKITVVDSERTWPQGWGEIELGFDGPWESSTSRLIYLELYRKLTHGHDLTPDDALAVLGGAYHAAVSEATAWET